MPAKHIILGACHAKHRHIRQEIRGFFDYFITNKGRDFGIGVVPQGDRVQNANVVVVAQPFKILKSAKMNVGRVVPLVGQGLTHRHNAFNAKINAVLPIGEVWKSYNAKFSDS